MQFFSIIILVSYEILLLIQQYKNKLNELNYSPLPNRVQNYILQLLTFADIICSIAVAAKNSVSKGGYPGAGFAAIWSCFVSCLLAYQGAKASWSKTGITPLLAGFLIGLAGMSAELFFVLMVLFFALGAEAQKNGWGKLVSITALNALQRIILSALINTACAL